MDKYVFGFDQSKTSDEMPAYPEHGETPSICALPETIIEYFLSVNWTSVDRKQASYVFHEARKLFLKETLGYDCGWYKDKVLKVWDTAVPGVKRRSSTMTLDEVTALLLSKTREDVVFLVSGTEPIYDIAGWAMLPGQMVTPDADEWDDCEPDSELEVESPKKRQRAISVSSSSSSSD